MRTRPILASMQSVSILASFTMIGLKGLLSFYLFAYFS